MNKRISIKRIPYPKDLPREKEKDVIIIDTWHWVETRFAFHGLKNSFNPWKIEHGRSISSKHAIALHSSLVDIVNYSINLGISNNSSLKDHKIRWALDRMAEGIVRALTKNTNALDGSVFANYFEWPGNTGGGAVEFYFWYAPIKTLRSVDRWLHDIATSEGVDVHERSFLLRALGRIDPEVAVSAAKELLVVSPWATSEVIGMYGGEEELELMKSTLPIVAKNEEARTRKHFEAGVRKLERRLRKAKASN